MNTQYEHSFQIRWSDVDPNGHLRGSIYLDFGDQTRIAYLMANGLDLRLMAKYKVGPVILNQHVNYLKEVHLGDSIRVNCVFHKMSDDFRKFGAKHEFFNNKGEKTCEVNMEGIWFSVATRKSIVPPEEISVILRKLEKELES